MPPQQALFPDESPRRRPTPSRGLFPSQQEDPLTRTVDAAGQVPADEAGRVFALRLKTGLPEAVIRANREEIAREAARADFDADAFRASYPRLAEWLQEDPTRASAAADDLPTLGVLERTLQVGANSARAFAAGFPRFNVGAFGVAQAGAEMVGATGWGAYFAAARQQAIDLAEATKGDQAGAGAHEQAFYSGFESLGSMVPGLAMSLATGTPGPVLATMGGVTGGEAFGQARDEGVSVARSALFGASQAAVEVATEQIPASWLLRDLTKRAGLVRLLVRQVAAEIPGEQVATVLQDLNEWATLNPDQPFTSYLEARPSAAATTLIATLTAVGAQTTLAVAGDRVLTSQRRRVEQGQRQAFFDGLAKGATESALVARLPAAAQEFLQRVTKDGPIEHLYAPAESFAEYWQSKGENPIARADQLTGRPGALAEARRTGADLVIPTAAYAVQIAPTEHHAFFAQELRLRPDQRNAREAAEASASDEAVASGAAEAAAVATDPAQARDTVARETVRQRVSDQARAAGARPDVADAWATLWAERVTVRAARLGVDPVALFEQSPPPQITSDTALPTPADGAPRGPIDIPPSAASATETPTQRETRRTAHLGAVASAVLRDARGVDPTVDEATIRRELEFRVAMEEERQALQRESGTGPDLLRAIASYGGLWWEPRTGAYRGEIERWAREAGDARERRGGVRASGPQTWNGVSGVFAETGLPPDRLLTSLRQDQRFESLETVNDLFDAVDQALGADPDVDTLPGSADLAALGIVPGTAWWADAWRGPAAEDVDLDESEPADGDASFDVAEFNQRIAQEIAADIAARLEGLTPATNTAGSRVVPFPTVSNAIASRLFRAADLQHATPMQVPVADLVATQETVSGPRVREKLEGAAADRPFVLDYHGKLYIADGTHRATAAWARGDALIDVVAARVDPARLAALTAQEGGEFFQRARAKAQAARAAARQARTEAALYQARPIEAELQRAVALPDAVPIIPLASPLELADVSPAELRRRAFAYAKAAQTHDVSNTHTGWTVKVSKDGLKKSANYALRPEQLVALQHIDELIDGGIYLRSETDRADPASGVQYDYLYTPFEWAGGSYVAKLAMRTGPRGEGRTFYTLHAQRVDRPAGVSVDYRSTVTAEPQGPDRSALSTADLLTVVNQARETTALFQESGDIKGGFNPATNTIRLVAGKADLSTFLHESGHAFLEELVADAETVGALGAATATQRQLVADAETVLRSFGFTGSIAAWRALSVDERRTQHEAFARGFEDYLMTGTAPSAELQSVFARFRAWLVAVYRRLRAGEVSPEIRGVFDRLLASDEALAAVEAEGSITPLFTDPATAGVDPLTFEAYRARVTEASIAARAEVDRRLMADWRREREAWWKQEREVVRKAVVEEVMQQPVFTAQSVIRTGALPNGETPSYGDGKPIKFSKASIIAEFGRELLPRLRLGKDYLYTVEGGLAADTLAELTGFPSGDALVQALLHAPRVERVIESETDDRMRQKHGDLLLDGMTLRETAEGAVHAQRASVIAAELAALTQGMAEATIPRPDQVRTAAAQQIARTVVRDLKPGLFLQASVRASRQAFDAFAANDRAGAVRAKQRELFSLALYRAARDAREQAEATSRRVRQYDVNTAARARVGKADQAFLDQIDGFLDRYEFAPVSQKVLDRRASLRQWVASLEREGMPISLPDELLDDARRVNWRELTVEELEGVGAAVDQIAHLARLKNKLLKANEARELSQVRAELATSIREAAPARERTHEPRLAHERTKAFFEGVFASHRKIASIVRELDGFADGGPMFEHVLRRINDAGNAEAQAHATATEQLYRIFQRYTPAERARLSKKQHIPALGGPADPLASLSKQARLMVALNWGNETNRQRIMDGKHWSQAQVEAILDTLDARDWDFVDAVTGFINDYWPAIAEKQRRVVGVAPTKVEATPVFTRFGDRPGGYFPLMFDGELSGKVFNLEDASAADMQKAAAYVHATTARGHVEERTEGRVTLPVRLDFGVIWEHVGRVIHDLTHHEMLIDVGRIVGSDEVQSAVYDTLGPKAFDQLRRGLKDIAVGDVPARHEMEGVMSHLRSGATIVGLGWSATTTLLQPLGLTQSINRIGARWVARGLGRWLRGAATMEKTVAGIHAKSSLMANRHRTMMREVHEIRNRLGVDTGRFTGWLDAALQGVSGGMATKQGLADSYFWAIGRAQMIADIPTWLGAYEKAAADPAFLAEDGTFDEARVIAVADQAVLDSQGGGQIKDLAAVQRGSPAWKLWTNFYSYFNVTFNLWTEAKRRANVRRHPAQIGRLAVDYLLLFAAPAVLAHVLRSALTGELDDELEDPEAFMKTLLGENLAYMAGSMIGLRELGGYLQGYSQYDGPAGARGIASLGRLVGQVHQGEVDEALLRALNTSTGVLFHYPAAQVDRTSRGIAALVDGRTDHPLAVLMGPPRE
jgi:hypothetical protein